MEAEPGLTRASKLSVRSPVATEDRDVSPDGADVSSYRGVSANGMPQPLQKLDPARLAVEHEPHTKGESKDEPHWRQKRASLRFKCPHDVQVEVTVRVDIYLAV